MKAGKRERKKGGENEVQAEGLEKENLLHDSDEGEGLGFCEKDRIHINKLFAAKYEQRKRRELLSKNKELLQEISEEESTSEEEDEEGDLLTPQVEKKLVKVLTLIKKKDPSIYDPKKVFFKDSDFTREEQQEEKEVSKRMRFKDVVRKALEEEGASAFVDDEENFQRRKKQIREEPAYHQELAFLKRQFLDAAKDADTEGDGFLHIKVKGREEEEKELQRFLDTKKGSQSEVLLAKFWADDRELDPKESFLRDYILNEAWREEKAVPAWQLQAEVDEEDEHQLEAADAFEASYNFRFEEEGGCEIKGHPRVVEDSVRQVDDKRKKMRERKNKQKEEERLRRKEELKRLKSLKREEIRERIRHIQQVGGLDDETVKSVLNLEADFDPKAHDQEMQQLFGDEYEAQHEGRSCFEMPEACAEILSTEHETAPETMTKKQRKLLKLQRRRARQAEALEGYAKEDDFKGEGNNQGLMHAAEEAQGDAREEQQGNLQAEWWMCDGCGKGIKGGKKRFDCLTCDNYTLCKICFRNVRHPHQLVRKTVPTHCNPPKDFECGAPASSAELNDLLDEYFQLDYEDIIGGDLPTRFKYRKVEAANYGISTEEILNSTDAELNSKVSLKKLATYREYDKLRAQAEEHQKLRRENEETKKCASCNLQRDDSEAKPWFRQKRNNEGAASQEDWKAKRREKRDKRMTAFGIRQDRLKAYDA
ncbi:hypothetical protein Esti_002243 [Eimeria stiedai]